MKLNKTIKISIRVILLFVCAMLISAIPEYLPVFGDWICQGSGLRITDSEYTHHFEHCNYGNNGYHDPENHWGYRHWLFLLMGITLFIVQVVDIISKAIEQQ